MENGTVPIPTHSHCDSGPTKSHAQATLFLNETQLTDALDQGECSGELCWLLSMGSTSRSSLCDGLKAATRLTSRAHPSETGLRRG